jgi:hypothetical protein
MAYGTSGGSIEQQVLICVSIAYRTLGIGVALNNKNYESTVIKFSDKID